MFKRAVLALVFLGYSAISLAEVKVEDAWVRLLPPNVMNTAAYVSFTSDVDDKILSVTSEVAERIELHNSTMEDGMMSMFQVEAIDLPAKQKVSLAPHGYHMMVMGLHKPLTEGSVVTFNVELEKAGKMSFESRVSREAP